MWHSLTFHIWKYTLDPENSTPKHHHQQGAPFPPFFPNFFPILMLFFIWHSLTFHIWKYALDPEGSTPKHHHQQWKTSPNNTDHHSYSFLIYSLFYTYFSPRKAYISIFGNAYWTLKAVPDVATNSKHHPYFFLFFLLFFCYFSFVKACISIFGNAPWTLKAVPQQYHQQGAPSSLFSPFFPAILLLFFICKSVHFLFRKCTLNRFVKVRISFFGNAPCTLE
jgi:hypothetical protein